MLAPSIVEVPIPNKDPIDNILGTGIGIKLRLNFNHVRIGIVVTHVLDLSAKMRRNEWLHRAIMTYSKHW